MNEERLDRLFNETLKLISEQGFYSTPMSQIAKKSGISMGSIYNQFENKEILLNELYKKIKIRFANHVLSKINGTESIEQQIKHMLGSIFYYYSEQRSEINFIEQYENSPLITEETQKQLQPYLMRVFQKFEEGKRKKVISQLPTEALIAMSFGAVSSLAKMYVKKIYSSRMPDTISDVIDAVYLMIKG
ncbi:TetR/AcrR family transcriptional regulator [Sporolactobacillus shoreicorticis]|uniref:TetR/AcrR family transcriptional regulator n=1 Tax=Sporolactobacillus shoreicorticis TaxID=1923877 RepID=A0ABW5RZ49_9BACL|nr:TetR/AcrR family transcriptional regulator [Sporolactobacillus shoreicorticis]MCO7128160.1 TetR/AcrR family transcriptional regulator [Sporolactobacillus shoreicorticis]